jgi:serine phosphatase RsbU (regulator of sigma subunit)/anti-sigma regulatory factor (Ser/Thr protein kinase)
VGRTPRILRSDRQPDSFYKHMWDTILAGRVWHGELYNRHKSGDIYVEEQTIAPVSDSKGVIVNFIGIKQDVTRRKQYEEMLERRNAELVTMAATIGTIAVSLEVDGVLRSIVNAVGDLVPHALGATVQVPDERGILITRAASSGLGPGRVPPAAFEPGRGVAGLAYRDRRIVNAGDVLEDERYLKLAPSPAYRSLLALPISSGIRVLGVLSVEGKDEHAFLQHEEDLLSLFAGSAAIAIGHAAENEARVKAEQALKRYSERLEFRVEERTADLRAAQEKLLEQQRLEREVVLAAQVQSSILPHHMPDMPGFEFAGVALAARYLSGDMYDWIGFGPDDCYLTLADIAGKGVPAAMMTSTARALLRDGAARKAPPGLALTGLNRFLYDDLTHAGKFITIVAAHLDRRTAALEYASAGHTELLWYRARQGACERLGATGPPIGVLPDVNIDERRIFLCPGDLLLFYSDGVTEAENDRGEFFGVDRLAALVLEKQSLPGAALARSIVDTVDAFSQGPRSDDLTLIVVKAMARTVPFQCRGDLAQVEKVLELFRALVRAYGANFACDLELALSGVLTNVVEHAYRSAGGEVRGEVRLEPDWVQVDVYDDGLPFELSALPAKDLDQPSVRGYGVDMVRQLMHEVSYSPATSAGNHWRLVKRRPPEGPADGR